MRRIADVAGRNGRTARRALWGLLACLTCAAPASAEEAIFPPGSAIGLNPPDGMEVSDDFTGFMNAANGASILLTALPAEAYDQIVAGFTADALAAKGLTLTGRCEAAKPAEESRCFRATQQAMGQQFQKWLLVVRFEEETVIAVATVPDSAIARGDYRIPQIDAALATIAYGNAAAEDPLSVLPFTIEEGRLLPFQQTLSGAAALYAAPPGVATPQPIWVVASSLGYQEEARTIAFSRAAFRDIASLVEPDITAEQAFDAGGLTGHIVEGRARDQETDAQLYVFQAIVVDDDGQYYRMIGITPEGMKDIYQPEFQRLIATLEPR